LNVEVQERYRIGGVGEFDFELYTVVFFVQSFKDEFCFLFVRSEEKGIINISAIDSDVVEWGQGFALDTVHKKDS